MSQPIVKLNRKQTAALKRANAAAAAAATEASSSSAAIPTTAPSFPRQRSDSDHSLDESGIETVPSDEIITRKVNTLTLQRSHSDGGHHMLFAMDQEQDTSVTITTNGHTVASSHRPVSSHRRRGSVESELLQSIKEAHSPNDDVGEATDHLTPIAIDRADSPEGEEDLESALLNNTNGITKPVASTASSVSDYRFTRSTSTGTSVNSGLHIGDFELLSVIGRGAYGKVFLVRRSNGILHDKYYAMKVIKKSEAIRKNVVVNMKTERTVLEAVRHPFIVNLRYAFQTCSKLYLVLDYIPGGELFSRLDEKRDHALSVKDARFYAAELVLALEYLHSFDIVYRDLKPENILLNRDGHIVLTDFGFAKDGIEKNEEGCRSFCGCLRADQMVRLADGGEIVAAKVKVGMRLASDEGAVTVIEATPPQQSLPTSNEFVQIVHEDGTEYVVTTKPEHIVTMRCQVGIEVVYFNDNTTEEQQEFAVRYFDQEELQVKEWGRRRFRVSYDHIGADDQTIIGPTTSSCNQSLLSLFSLTTHSKSAATLGQSLDIAINKLLAVSEEVWKGKNAPLHGIKLVLNEDSSVASSTGVSITSITPLPSSSTFQYAPFAVSGNNRYLLANGTLTHNTLHYLSPEIISYSGHGKGSDWWSLGCCLYEMLTGTTPFNGSNRKKIQDNILSAPLKLPNFLDQPTKSILTEFLRRSIPKRLGCGPEGVAAIKKHKFFESIDWVALAKKQVPAPFIPVLDTQADTKYFDTKFTEERVVDTPLSTSEMASILQGHGISPQTFHEAESHFINFSFMRDHTPAPSPALRAIIAARSSSTGGGGAGSAFASPRVMSGLPPAHHGSSYAQSFESLELPPTKTLSWPTATATSHSSSASSATTSTSTSSSTIASTSASASSSTVFASVRASNTNGVASSSTIVTTTTTSSTSAAPSPSSSSSSITPPPAPKRTIGSPVKAVKPKPVKLLSPPPAAVAAATPVPASDTVTSTAPTAATPSTTIKSTHTSGLSKQLAQHKNAAPIDPATTASASSTTATSSLNSDPYRFLPKYGWSEGKALDSKPPTASIATPAVPSIRVLGGISQLQPNSATTASVAPTTASVAPLPAASTNGTSTVPKPNKTLSASAATFVPGMSAWKVPAQPIHQAPQPSAMNQTFPLPSTATFPVATKMPLTTSNLNSNSSQPRWGQTTATPTSTQPSVMPSSDAFIPRKSAWTKQ